MIMLIDTLADRYKLLPSEVLTRATTFDVMVADTVISYRNELEKRANKEANPSKYTDDELLEIVKQTRGES